MATIFAGLAVVVTRGREAIAEVLRAATASDLTDGRFAQKIDKAIFRAVPRSAMLDGVVAGLEYRLLRDAGRQVYAGCSDWLYSMEELRAERRDVANMTLRAELLSQLVRMIRQAGALPVIVPVPDKADQVQSELCGVDAGQSRLRDEFWADIGRVEGAIVVDVRKGWPKPGYWRTDTHWDQRGARFAAQAIAQALAGAIGAGSNEVRLVEGSMHERVGDLARLAGLTDAPRVLAPSPEQEKEVKAEIARSGGLLDDAPEPSIILAGSSFSLNSAFFDYLEASLSREVAQVSQAGGGFAGALIETLEKRPASLARAKAVIWEWPMRSLVAPLSEAEQNLIKQARSSGDTKRD